MCGISGCGAVRHANAIRDVLQVSGDTAKAMLEQWKIHGVSVISSEPLLESLISTASTVMASSSQPY